MHFILFYDVVDDYVTKRVPYRPQHLDLARAAYDRGELVLAGALANPADGAVLVFRDAKAAEAFVASDPYVKNGLVARWRIREWTTVIGDGITPPSL
ncbi:YciI family protein [Pendulispora brunnea]|uniref:YciI family protein n=1 Tax=Pendulispora brunnea TaxID=2905690 RepID=A0ABZ2K8R4_9BACT